MSAPKIRLVQPAGVRDFDDLRKKWSASPAIVEIGDHTFRSEIPINSGHAETINQTIRALVREEAKAT